MNLKKPQNIMRYFMFCSGLLCLLLHLYRLKFLKSKKLRNFIFKISCWESFAERIVHAIRQRYLRAILQQEISWFDKMQTGDLTARLTEYFVFK